MSWVALSLSDKVCSHETKQRFWHSGIELKCHVVIIVKSSLLRLNKVLVKKVWNNCWKGCCKLSARRSMGKEWAHVVPDQGCPQYHIISYPSCCQSSSQLKPFKEIQFKFVHPGSRQWSQWQPSQVRTQMTRSCHANCDLSLFSQRWSLSSYRETLERAFRVWERVADLKFSEASGPPGDLEIR